MAGNDLFGTLDLLVLKSLDGAGSQHAYGIGQLIASASKDLLRVEEGSLYPAVQRMESAGWLTAKWSTTESGRRAKYYKLTAAGRRHLRQTEEQFERVVKGVRGVLGRKAPEAKAAGSKRN